MNTPKLPAGKARWIVLAIVVVAAAAAWLWTQRSSHDDELLHLYGNVDIREVQLAFRQPGRVAQMLFDEGDAVSAGERMATLDAQPYQDALAAADAAVRVAQAELSKLQTGLRPQEIAQAQAALNQAQAVADEAERNFHRQTDLLASGASSQRTVDAARAARDQAVAGVKAARAALSQATEGFRVEECAGCNCVGRYRTDGTECRHRHRTGARAGQHGRKPKHRLQPEP